MPSKKNKLVVLTVALLTSAGFAGYGLSLFNQEINTDSSVVALTGLTLFLIFFLFQALLIKNFWLSTAFCLGEMIFILVPIYRSLNATLLLAGAASAFILITTIWLSQKELQNRLRFDFWTNGRYIVSRAAFAVILLGVVIYMKNVSFDNIVTSFLAPSQVAIQKILPQLPGGISEAATSQAQKLILDQLNQLPELIKKIIVIVFGVLIFFTVKTSFIVVDWIVVGLAFLLYKALRAIKFITLFTQEAKQTIIEL